MKSFNPFRKKSSPPADAKPLFRGLLKLQEQGRHDEVRDIVDKIGESMESHGRELLERAFKEGILTPREWTQWSLKYGADYSTADSILTPLFWQRDKQIPKDDQPVILSVEGSPIYKMRALVRRRFGLKVWGKRDMVLHTWDTATGAEREELKQKLKITSRRELVKRISAED